MKAKEYMNKGVNMFFLSIRRKQELVSKVKESVYWISSCTVSRVEESVSWISTCSVSRVEESVSWISTCSVSRVEERVLNQP